MPPRPVLERCRRIPTATWSDALDRAGIVGVIAGLRLRAGRLPIAAPVTTVEESVGPLGYATPAEFGIDRILRVARAGEIVLIHQAGEPAASAVGGLAAIAARRHGVVGIVIDGACRDIAELEEVGLPILSRTVTPASGRGRARIEAVGEPLRIGEVEVVPGDVAVADQTGVVLLPVARLEELLALAEERAAEDAAQAAALREERSAQT